MPKCKKHNQVFKILSIIIQLRQSCSVFLFKETFLEWAITKITGDIA